MQVFDEYEEQSDIADKFRIKVHSSDDVAYWAAMHKMNIREIWA